MKKYLITGFAGFVGPYFIQHLNAQPGKSEILGLDVQRPEFLPQNTGHIKVEFDDVDLLDSDRLKKIVYAFRPDYVLHLASYSSVGFSWKDPALSVRNNLNIFLNLMEVLRKVHPVCRVLSVGSSEEYGNFPLKDMPLKENHPLRPVSPYAVARVSQEQLSKVYAEGYGLDVVMTRSFNHLGAGQKDMFVISSFVKQLVEIKKGLGNGGKLVAGDISIVRDFLDVRDVTDAYYRLFQKGEKGEVYNICSGQGHSLREVIDMICDILQLRVEIEIDPARIRPSDNRVIVGSSEKISTATGWKPRFSLRESLEEIIRYWFRHL